MIDDPTKVMVRRILAYLIDLAATLALAGAMSVGLFMLLSVEGSYATPPPGVKTDRSSVGPCDEERQLLKRVRVPKNRHRNRRPRYRLVPETRVPSFCADFGGGSIRYIEDDHAFTNWILASLVAASAIDLVLLQGLTGASLGKWLLGLRVVGYDGARVGMGMTAWRWFLLAVDSLCCAIPGLLLAFTKPGHQRLGDLGARTVVVKQSAAGSPIDIPGLAH